MQLNRQITNVLGLLAMSLICITCGLFTGGDLNRPIEPDFLRFVLLAKASMIVLGMILCISACLALFRYAQRKSK